LTPLNLPIKADDRTRCGSQNTKKTGRKTSQRISRRNEHKGRREDEGVLEKAFAAKKGTETIKRFLPSPSEQKKAPITFQLINSF